MNANNNKVNFTNDFPRALSLLGCNYYSWQYGEMTHYGLYRLAWADVRRTRT